jgi:hypothetical protein
MKPFGTLRDAIRPNGFFVEAIVNSAPGSKFVAQLKQNLCRFSQRYGFVLTLKTLGKTAVGAQNLAVDPGAVGTRKE